VDLGAIYEPTWIAQIRSNIKLILLIILSVGGLAAFIVRYQRGRPVAEQTYAHALSSSQRIVFKHLMLLPPDQSITTNELNQLLSLEDKTWDNQRKIRSTVLQELEEKGMQYLGVPSFIERISSDEDRRIRRYRIKPELRDDLTSVLKYV
jgi:DNA-binding MarR family transcriptional regulator